MTKAAPQADKILAKWYREHRRSLPWRTDNNPYRIWISEVMLQQTTVTAVIPYYQKFLTRFPDIESLAKASQEEVLEYWAGLGYYSRAKNLHKAAGQLLDHGFPKKFEQLLELPGFGPYTSRAVASLAFNQRVGVLDGNVIRVLSRYLGKKIEWWKPEGRNYLQSRADELVQIESPSEINQGLMELGATICTSQNPACLLCPWSHTCVARLTGQVKALPLSKPRRSREIWIWRPAVHRKGSKVAVIENTYAPFLKGHLMWPGQAKRASKAPKTFAFKGSVTHHDIFVVPQKLASNLDRATPVQWIDSDQLRQKIPSSLIRKVLDYK